MSKLEVIDAILSDILATVNPSLKHDETVGQIERIFKKHGFFTTREYPIYRMKDGTKRSGRIDLVARKGKFRVAVEYDHRLNVKYKSFQKITQIHPETAIAITGSGYLKSNLARAAKYNDSTTMPLYVVSLKERKYTTTNEL